MQKLKSTLTQCLCPDPYIRVYLHVSLSICMVNLVILWFLSVAESLRWSTESVNAIHQKVWIQPKERRAIYSLFGWVYCRSETIPQPVDIMNKVPIWSSYPEHNKWCSDLLMMNRDVWSLVNGKSVDRNLAVCFNPVYRIIWRILERTSWTEILQLVQWSVSVGISWQSPRGGENGCGQTSTNANHR